MGKHPWTEKDRERKRKWYLENREIALKRNRSWQKRNPEKMKEANRRFQKRHPERVKEIKRKADLKAKYGLTLADFDAMLRSQKGRCKLCGVDRPGGKYGVWHIDHKDKKIRGLLCHHCNVGLGHFKDDPILLRKAVLYLKC